MKKLFTLIFAFLTLMCATAFAEDGIRVMYNGEYLEFADASPIIIDGRVLLPFRGVFERMGASVSYDDSTRAVRADFGTSTVSFSLDGREIASSEGTVYTMDVPPTVINGRTLVPVRAVAEAAGLTVDWDNDERTVVIINEDAISGLIAAKLPVYRQLSALAAASAKIYSRTEAFSVTDETGEALDLRGEVSADGQAERIFFTATADGEKHTTEIIITSDTMYFQTDAAAKEPQGLFSPEKWYYIDLNELETFISGDARGVLPAAADEILNTPLCLILADDYIESLAEGLMASYERLNASPAAAARNVFGGLLSQAAAEAENGLSVTENGAQTHVTVACPEGGELEAVYSGGRLDSAKIDGVFDGKAVKGTIFAKEDDLVEKIEIPEDTVNFVDALYTARYLN